MGNHWARGGGQRWWWCSRSGGARRRPTSCPSRSIPVEDRPESIVELTCTDSSLNIDLDLGLVGFLLFGVPALVLLAVPALVGLLIVRTPQFLPATVLTGIAAAASAIPVATVAGSSGAERAMLVGNAAALAVSFGLQLSARARAPLPPPPPPPPRSSVDVRAR